ncbi:MAG: acetate--CoA ligase family protein [Patescibacteria group bacterium]
MSYQALFYPKAIAMIGASRNLKTVGNDVVKNLVTQGYEGEIYPVNPKADKLYGKKVYASVEQIPGDIDLAVIAVPASFVTAEIEKAAAKGAKAAIVISAGCKEIGNIELERNLSAKCRELGVSLVGPNCLGIINPEIKMNASFAALMPEPGDVAFVSQSGALCTAVLDYAKELGIGFSKFMSIGNKADINELKLIKYFAQDPQTKVIAMYVEQLENAPELIKTVQEITRGKNPKPIIMLKSGKTEAGAGAIASHTGSLSGGDIAYESLFAQAGIIRAESISQLFDYAQIFSKNSLQKVRRVSIITNAGGPGVLTTDAVVESGLEMAELAPKTVKALREFLPAAASTHNPVDILGDAVGDRYKQALELVAEDPNTDAIILLLTPQSMTEIVKTAKAVVATRANTNKPMIVSFMGQETVQPGVDAMKQAGVVTSTFPEPAAKAMATFGKFVDRADKPIARPLRYADVDKEKVGQIFAAAKAKGKTSFPESEAIEILAAYGFPMLQSAQAATAVDAKKAATKMAGKKEMKFAMKIVSQDILHKSDVGGVMLNVTCETVEDSFKQMMKTVAKNKPEARLDGVLLVEMAPAYGTETILGVNRAPGLGTMVMFGLGGIYVEVLKDVSLAFVPLTKTDAERMIDGLRSSAIFAGVRGQKPADRALMIESIGRLAQLVSDFPEIVELDINPLLVLPEGEGVKALDARIVIE